MLNYWEYWKLGYVTPWHFSFLYITPVYVLNTGCEDGWMYFNESCYFFSSDFKNWSEAKAQCEITDLPSHILVINSAEEQTFIFNQWNLDTIFWIGCNDMNQDGTWTCADDSEVFFTEGGDQNGYWSKFRRKSYDEWAVIIHSPLMPIPLSSETMPMWMK